MRSGEDGDFGEVDVFGDGGEEGDGLGDVFRLEDVDLVDQVGREFAGVGVDRPPKKVADSSASSGYA